MDIPMLKVEQRQELGKTSTTKLRHQGLIPAVCYGKAKKTLSLSVDPEELTSILMGPHGVNALIQLDGTEEERTVFVQDIQKHPVSRLLVHVDFIHVDPNKPVIRKVPMVLVGRPEGVKLGGILQFTNREILLETLPSTVPTKIEIDVSELLIGESIHVEEVKLPEGVKALFDINFTVCAVVAPAEEEVEEEAAEGEEVEGEEAGAEGAEGAGKEGEDKAAGAKGPEGSDKKAETKK